MRKRKIVKTGEGKCTKINRMKQKNQELQPEYENRIVKWNQELLKNPYIGDVNDYDHYTIAQYERLLFELAESPLLYFLNHTVRQIFYIMNNVDTEATMRDNLKTEDSKPSCYLRYYVEEYTQIKVPAMENLEKKLYQLIKISSRNVGTLSPRHLQVLMQAIPDQKRHKEITEILNRKCKQFLSATSHKFGKGPDGILNRILKWPDFKELTMGRQWLNLDMPINKWYDIPVMRKGDLYSYNGKICVNDILYLKRNDKIKSYGYGPLAMFEDGQWISGVTGKPLQTGRKSE